ncbi:hypothetical protein MMC22_001058 [Lobaria immixta]|nr:hypothetical protein [Lobaria immixta]
MKSIIYYVVAFLALANFTSAGGKKHFTSGGTILDIQKPNGNPNRVRSLFGRRAMNNQ